MGDESSIHVQGHLTARLGIECGRCLDPVTVPFEQLPKADLQLGAVYVGGTRGTAERRL